MTPSPWLPVAVLVAVGVAFPVQIRMEEGHLQRMHGPTYDAYCATVPRWIGPRGHPPKEPAVNGRPVDRG